MKTETLQEKLNKKAEQEYYKIKFTACKYLDFTSNYTGKKVLIVTNGTKICWNRAVIDESFPKLVQFCSKMGRMNNPEACLSERTKRCNDYENFKHIVILNNNH